MGSAISMLQDWSLYPIKIGEIASVSYLQHLKSPIYRCVMVLMIVLWERTRTQRTGSLSRMSSLAASTLLLFEHNFGFGENNTLDQTMEPTPLKKRLAQYVSNPNPKLSFCTLFLFAQWWR